MTMEAALRITLLVSVVTTKVTADLDYANASTGDVCQATVELIVDGITFNFVIKVTTDS